MGTISEEKYAEGLTEVEHLAVEYFSDAARLLGLPKSLGGIYGLSFVTEGSLALDDFVSILGVSKGTASQGLKMLRTLGALREVRDEGGRKTRYVPNLELKRLVSGFIKQEVLPHLQSGEEKLQKISRAIESEDDRDLQEFYQERFEKLNRWSNRSRMMLPFVQRFLGE